MTAFSISKNRFDDCGLSVRWHPPTERLWCNPLDRRLCSPTDNRLQQQATHRVGDSSARPSMHPKWTLRESSFGVQALPCPNCTGNEDAKMANCIWKLSFCPSDRRRRHPLATTNACVYLSIYCWPVIRGRHHFYFHAIHNSPLTFQKCSFL